MYRIETCEERLRAYLNGEVANIEELEETTLAQFKGYEGEGIYKGRWITTVTTCNL